MHDARDAAPAAGRGADAHARAGVRRRRDHPHGGRVEGRAPLAARSAAHRRRGGGRDRGAARGAHLAVEPRRERRLSARSATATRRVQTGVHLLYRATREWAIRRGRSLCAAPDERPQRRRREQPDPHPLAQLPLPRRRDSLLPAALALVRGVLRHDDRRAHHRRSLLHQQRPGRAIDPRHEHGHGEHRGIRDRGSRRA